MNATLDGIVLFEQHQLTVESWQRDSAERAVAGLDGVLSVDLGKRSRELVQVGVFRASSEAGLKHKIDAVNLLADGNTHTLITQDGQRFDNVRIDSFVPGEKDYSGAGVRCEFEIKYTQLRD